MICENGGISKPLWLTNMTIKYSMNFDYMHNYSLEKDGSVLTFLSAAV